MNFVVTESPRDAFQSWQDYIPAQAKADYINSLLKIGFDIIDVGSFVSEKAIPQLKDTAEVLNRLKLSDSTSAIMVLVANLKGMEMAVQFNEVAWLAFPYSLSPTFLKRNINIDMQQGIHLIEQANNLCEKNNKMLKVYLTMGFGNPYGDLFDLEIVKASVTKLYEMGVRYITLSDITGESSPELIKTIYTSLISSFPFIQFGLHLHTSADTYYQKLDAAYQSGCCSFDTVLNGMGGCPMTGYELLGNLNTLDLLNWCKINQIECKLQVNEIQVALKKNLELFLKNPGTLFQN